MDCLDEQTALTLLDGRRALADPEAFSEHLDSCAWCRRLVAEIARGGSGGESGNLVLDEARGLAPGAAVGRFVVDRELGRGAMGAVYSAYDPELDRNLALKLLHSRGAADRELEARLLREARTMARLSHPNIVPIYEVGQHEGALFIAMELVEGETLREWLAAAQRAPTEVLAVLLGAADGLAAAHAAGLVHRDFKPENVLVGCDGRARVGDFGLARDVDESPVRASADAPADAQLTQTGALVGTPAYMAPEQMTASPVNAKSDQFSFCVVLYEALFGRRPFAGQTLGELFDAILGGADVPRGARVPVAVRRALARGLSAEPSTRFPGMEALAARLRRPAWLRRPAVLAMSAAIIAGAIAVVATGAVHGSPAVCGDGAEELAGVWDGARRWMIQGAFSRTGSPLAADAFARTASELDRYTAAWTAMHRRSCEATRVHGEASEALLDRRMSCLAERRGELRALVDALADHPDRHAVEHARDAASALASPDTCSEPEATDLDPAPVDPALRGEQAALRAGVQRAAALQRLGRRDDAINALASIVQRAGELDFPRLRADALYERAVCEVGLRRDVQAAADLEDAAYAAQAAKHDLIAARAASLALVAYADAGDLPHARAWLRPAEAAVARLDDAGTERGELAAHIAWMKLVAGDLADAEAEARKAAELGCDGAPQVSARCAHLDTLGTVLLKERKRDEALAIFRREVELVELDDGPHHPNLAAALESEAKALDEGGRAADAVPVYERALAIWDGGAGASPASLLTNLGNALMNVRRYDDAERDMRRALVLSEQQQGENHPDVGISLIDLAILLDRSGKRGNEAMAMRRRALAIFERLGPTHPLVASALNAIGRQLVIENRSREAVPLFERALAIFDSHAKPGHVPAPTSFTLSLLGDAELKARQPARAVATLERALTLAPEDPDIQFNLANALWGSGGDRARVHALVQQALAGYRQRDDHGGADDAEHWIADHR